MLGPLLKGIRVAPFVECPGCHLLSEYGVKKCVGCSAEINSEEDATIYVVVLNMGASYTPFVECPNCRKLVKVGVRRCPACYEEVTEEYAVNSALAVVINTIACDVANSIKGFESFAILAVIGSVLSYALDLYILGSPRLFYIVLFWPMMPLLSILLWFYRFGRFSLGDEEYLSAKRDMRRMLMMWLAILAAQLIALAVWWL